MCAIQQPSPFTTTTPQIYRYIRARAAWEGQEFDLSVTFFRQMLARGARLFFGANTNARGDVLSDSRFPEFFLQWSE